MILILCILMQIEASVELTPEFARKKLTVGDPFEIILTIKYPQGKKLSEPFVDSLDPYVILDQKNQVVQEKGSVTSTYHIKLTAFNTGDLKLPRFKFLYEDSQDSTGVDTFTSAETRLAIASVISDKMADINDIKEQYEFPNLLPLIILGIVVAAGLLFFIGYRMYLRFRRLRAETGPQIPCWDEALTAIDKLDGQEFLVRGLIKKFYYALSEILKRYLEKRFEFPAIEQTTTEIVNSMKFQKTPLRDEFGRFFNRADMVKYARLVPPQNEVEGIATLVKELISKTKPVDVVEGEK